jgi:hypothetical protein
VTSLFAYPSQASVRRTVPKSRIYRFGLATERLQDRFVQQVEEIVWAYKLAPETVNLPPAGDVSEIQVFHVVLRGAELDDAVLATIDRGVNFPILFELVAADGMRVQPVAAYKRRSEASPDRQVIGDYLHDDWLPADAERAPLPFALDLSGLYAALLRPLIPLPPRPGEDLRAQLERLDRMRAKEREVRHAEARLRRERQFNRKVSLNAELRRLRAELARLSDPAVAPAAVPADRQPDPKNNA